MLRDVDREHRFEVVQRATRIVALEQRLGQQQIGARERSSRLHARGLELR
jgi:hypothetical protein